MPSFRTIFVLAATAFAALTSAAPHSGGDAVSQLGGTDSIAGIASGTIKGVNANGNEASVFDRRGALDGVDKDAFIDSIGGGLGIDVVKRHNGETHETYSLCEVLVDVEAKLSVVSSKLTSIVAAKVAVELQVILGIIAEVKLILAGAVIQVKAIVGHPTEFVLSLGGKVLALADVCHLLVSVLSLLCAIMTCILRIAGTASVSIIYPLIVAVGVILAELLCVIFTLVDGLYIAVQPFLGPIINVCVLLKLTAVVEVLNGKF
ncbi:hypothetical protein D9615_005576 [Tricholomella constricta]|uniref:Transmembrane protein n=1 Tax=Tricholomella constricta TaxID=117010 RepID=A0A8H5HEM2_9AGAR|nr:hypothetical protein D9615_005576 [Tricholomella constricta]